MTEAAGAWGQLSWTYDAAGNRLSEAGSSGSTSYSYSAATQRLMSTSGGASESFTYDAIGRMTADGRGTYAYTPTSRLATANTPAGQASYAYTPEDFRIATVLSNTTKYTIRNSGQEVLSEYEGSVWKRDLIYAGGRLLGSVHDSSLEFYATDVLGSTRVVFDAAGVAVARSDYKPFGEALNASGDLPAQRFTSQERDEEGGLDYFNARMYQPRTGRLTAIDPVFIGPDNPQDWNRYAYVRNNPLVFTDPSGMTLCTQSSGPYWCPSLPIWQQPNWVDDQFDPNKKGYQGGEEILAAEQRHAGEMDARWDQGRHDEYFRQSALVQNGCLTTFCMEVVGKYSASDIELNKLAMEIQRRAAPITDPWVIGEFYVYSAVGGAVGAISTRVVIVIGYPNAGGGGISLVDGGKRITSLDWHRFKDEGPRLPHIDWPGVLGKHWPWKSDWWPGNR